MAGPIVPSMTLLEFDPEFEYRQVVVLDVPMIVGTGTALLNGMPICVLGDEREVVLNAMYEIPSYSPGQGIVTILALGPGQISTIARNGLQIILGEGEFIAQFEPTTPASQIPTGTPDPAVPSLGTGRFLVTQFAAQAS